MIAEALAAAAALAGADRGALSRISGPLGDAARTAFDELSGLAPDAQRDRRAGWAAAARASVPQGLRGIDPSWIEAALADLPAAARTAVSAGESSAAAVWLARWACAALPPMRAMDPALVRPITPHDIGCLGASALQSWLEDVGADQLAFALGSHAPDAASLFGKRLLVAARRIGSAPRDGQLGQRRAAIERARIEPAPEALLRIGARTIAPHTDPLIRAEISVRFPRPMGRRIAEELRAAASAPVEHTATWTAITAP